ncbi:MAG: hypothetical protein IPK83_19075 [Planctomycetes bacterium]|nr:hypothetical protein [Planctomycetota bacterium]
MTHTKETRTRHQDLLERILAMVESIDRNVEEILDELHDHLTDMRYNGWTDEVCNDDLADI